MIHVGESVECFHLPQDQESVACQGWRDPLKDFRSSNTEAIDGSPGGGGRVLTVIVERAEKKGLENGSRPECSPGLYENKGNHKLLRIMKYCPSQLPQKQYALHCIDAQLAGFFLYGF